MIKVLGIALIMCAGMVGVAEAAADNKTEAQDASITSQELPELPEDEQGLQYNVAVLQGLNKVTGQISTFENSVGSATRFGTLEIALHRCWKSAPEDQPENAALIEISELRSKEAPHKIFLGWIFSSSPGLSGIEHPVYDITLLGCEQNEGTDAPTEEKRAEKEAPAKPKKK